MINKIIESIKNSNSFEQDDINLVITDYVNGKYTDEDILPLIKQIYHSSINDKSLYYLTDAMKNSGEVLNLSTLGKVVDKHSSGGVSDTTTLIIAPICACLGVNMLKLSGKALGFTGGTIDKLLCFNGYNVDVDLQTAISLTKQNGACIMAANTNIAPADKKIYTLRDKHGLVDNIPLIASSIMSKKLASGADIIVLDVKYGNGAFMPDIKSAKLLAKKMISLGKLAGKKVKVTFGNMDEPLGYNIGSKLETIEAISILKGQFVNSRLYKHSVHLASLCVSLYKNIPYFIAKQKVKKVIKNKLALEKFKQMIAAQGGKLDLFNQQLSAPDYIIKAETDGTITNIHTKNLGQLAHDLCLENNNDSSGLILHFNKNDKIYLGDKLFSIYCENEKIFKKYEKIIKNCIKIEKK